MDAPDKIYLNLDESEISKDILGIAIAFNRVSDDDIEYYHADYLDDSLDFSIYTSIEFFEWLLEKGEWDFDSKNKVWKRPGHKNRTTIELYDTYIEIMSSINEN
jgi:hypothetical protein